MTREEAIEELKRRGYSNNQIANEVVAIREKKKQQVETKPVKKIISTSPQLGEVIIEEPIIDIKEQSPVDKEPTQEYEEKRLSDILAEQVGKISPKGEKVVKAGFETVGKSFHPKETASLSLEMGLPTAGSLLAQRLGLSLFPIAAASGLGYGAAKEIERLTGLTPQAPNLGSAVTSAIQNIGTGAIMEGAPRAILGVAQGILKPTKGLTKIQQETLELADKMGVKLTPGRALEDPVLEMFEGILNRIVFSEGSIYYRNLENMKALLKQRGELIAREGSTETIEQTGKAIQKEADKLINEATKSKLFQTNEAKDLLLKRLGSEEKYIDLGKTGVDAIKKASQAWFDKAQKLYIIAGKDIPEGTKIETKNAKRLAKGLLTELLEASPEYRNDALINLLKNTAGISDEALTYYKLTGKFPIGYKPKEFPLSWKGLQLQIQTLNEWKRATDEAIRLGQPGIKGMSTKASGIYKQLQKAFIKDIDEFVNTGNEAYKVDLKANLKIANTLWGEGKMIFNDPAIKQLLRARPEDFIDIATSGVSEIRVFKQAIDEKGFLALKQGLTKKLVNSFESGAQFNKLLDKYSDDVLREIYKPTELVQLRSLASKDIRLTEDLVKNNKFFLDILNKRPEKVVDFIVQPENTANIDLIEKHLGKPAVDRIARQFLTNKLKLNEYQFISPQELLKELHKYGDTTLNRLLGASVWKSLQEFVRVGNAARGVEDIAKGTFGSRSALISFTTSALVIRNPMKGGMLIGALDLLPKLYLSPAAMKWLTKGLTINPTHKEATVVFSKLMSIIGLHNLKKVSETEKPVTEDDLSYYSMEMQRPNEYENSTVGLAIERAR